MALTKAKKTEILSKVREALKGATSVVFANFHGLPVSTSTLMRRSMREKGVGFMVAKKTLVRLALEEMGYAGTVPELAGELAIAYGADAVMPAKEVADFAKKNEGKLAILGGVYEGTYMSAVDMKALAAIPSRDTLLGMLANVWSAPARGLVIALDQISKKQ